MSTATKLTPEAREKPILFSGPMVRAILEGRKTQTRRVVGATFPRWGPDARPDTRVATCPYGAPGDRLWVRETWAWPGEEEVLYRATDQHLQDKCKSDPLYPQWNWKPSIYMPRWASRLTLEITDVRVERLQDISAEDCAAEGLARYPAPDGRDWWGAGLGTTYLGPRRAFEALWDSINGERPGCSWEANPWVWVVSFRPTPGRGG